ncbi:MAG: hypothetical protein GX425_05645 [Peptococcaceae bacterium]|nr:hypothetical protein [Peptococcaceae bacterium]
MDCREALFIIAEQPDGALSGEDSNALAEHLACCSVCARELGLQKRLSETLRKIGRDEVPAPPDLRKNVMSRVRLERRSALARLPEAWRKAVLAAAAALLLLAGGSAGINAGLQLAGTWKTVVQAPPAIDNKGDPTVISDNRQPPRGDPAQPADTGKEPGVNTEPGSGDKGAGRPNNPSGDPGEALPANTSGGQSAASAVASWPEGTRALMSGGMKTNSTFLKVAVGSLAEARAKAVAFAAGEGAFTQVWPEQSGDKKIIVIWMSLPADRAPELVTKLIDMGTVIDRTDESRDITFQYNEKAIQYNDLLSRLSSARDAEERRQLENQAATYKQQLDDWESEAGKRVITLWLESN